MLGSRLAIAHVWHGKPRHALQLNGDPVTFDTLRASLTPLLNADRPRLHILADRDVPAGALVSLIQRADLQGIEIKLVTLRQFKPNT